MIRRQAREKALQILFQIDINQGEPQDIIRERFELDEVDANHREFIAQIVTGTYENLNTIDEKIKSILKGWDLDRIGKVERSVLRLAIYELMYSDLAQSIIINEAVELAKVFSTNKSAGFINGILAKMVDKVDGNE
ncbi:transcription antitermination factor NusB [Desulfuribacillus stibiiarsenatis]|uniref:Transcription antitermination protein NusB n=1 Tax=Desulfuribacillus stibiiarsenatis TaxID=1390249 RepID=A0A1E5L679_9FIRM|nr:transcription antitermination factor NusB [Desulfuribacillus stibiiarsenatis]OEH85662.1 transcription antitermination factor NusB [Desulfuribacillus stibiiarsenatis]